jgi:hypothetical protein
VAGHEHPGDLGIEAGIGDEGGDGGVQALVGELEEALFEGGGDGEDAGVDVEFGFGEAERAGAVQAFVGEADQGQDAVEVADAGEEFFGAFGLGELGRVGGGGQAFGEPGKMMEQGGGAEAVPGLAGQVQGGGEDGGGAGTALAGALQARAAFEGADHGDDDLVEHGPVATALLLGVLGQAELDGAGGGEFEVELVEGGLAGSAGEVDDAAGGAAGGQGHADDAADVLGDDGGIAVEALVLLGVGGMQGFVLGEGLLDDRPGDRGLDVGRGGADGGRDEFAGGTVAAEDQGAFRGHGLHQQFQDPGLLDAGVGGIADEAADLVEDAQALGVVPFGVLFGGLGEVGELVDAELEGVGEELGVVAVVDPGGRVGVRQGGAGFEDEFGGADLDHIAEAQELLVTQAVVVDVGAVLGFQVADEPHAAHGEDLAVESRGGPVEDLDPGLGVAADGHGLVGDGLFPAAVRTGLDAQFGHAVADRIRRGRSLSKAGRPGRRLARLR